MYERFYGLTADPFRLSPDHRFCFNHDNFAKAKAYIDYALHRAEGFVMITGRPGTGKTTLVHDLLDRLAAQDVKVATLMSTRLGAEDLLRMTAYAFGLDSHAPHKAMVLQGLLDFLSQQYQYGKRSLLIIDESQDLSAAALEELRLLTNLQHAGQPLLQIVLIGQESLRDLVRSRELEQLHQRLLAAWHLEPLSPQELVGYIQHRLVTAGWRGDPEFQPGVMQAIYRFSGGVPRMINLVCSRLLLHGFIEELHLVTVADIDFVLGELRQEELTPQAFATADDVDQPIPRTAAEVTAAKIDWARIDTGLSAQMIPPASAAPTAPLVSNPLPPAARRDDSPPPLSKILHHEDDVRWKAEPAAPPAANVAAESPAPVHPLLARRWLLALVLGFGLSSAGAALYLRYFIAWRPVVAEMQEWARATAAAVLMIMDAPPAPNPQAPTPVTPERLLASNPAPASPANWETSPPIEAAPNAAAAVPGSLATAPAAVAPDTLLPTAPAIATASHNALASMTETDLSAAGEAASRRAVSAPLTISVLFARNSTTVEPQFAASLAEVIARLNQFPAARVTVIGYSDRYGNAAYNLELSRRRANAVADYLVAQGAARTQLNVSGRGPRDQPGIVGDSTDAAGRMVELTVTAPTQ